MQVGIKSRLIQNPARRRRSCRNHATSC